MTASSAGTATLPLSGAPGAPGFLDKERIIAACSTPSS